MRCLRLSGDRRTQSLEGSPGPPYRPGPVPAYGPYGPPTGACRCRRRPGRLKATNRESDGHTVSFFKFNDWHSVRRDRTAGPPSKELAAADCRAAGELGTLPYRVTACRCGSDPAARRITESPPGPGGPAPGDGPGRRAARAGWVKLPKFAPQ